MKSKKMLVMICAFAAVIGVFALVNAKEKPIEYSREELAELFEKYPVSLLCKEFDEKKVILSNPSSKEELNALIGGLTLEDPKPFDTKGRMQMEFLTRHLKFRKAEITGWGSKTIRGRQLKLLDL